jgi:hypothetical protein
MIGQGSLGENPNALTETSFNLAPSLASATVATTPSNSAGRFEIVKRQESYEACDVVVGTVKINGKKSETLLY